MLDRHVFEYAVIRVVPRVEREEFINVGVVLYCKSKKFLQAKWALNSDRLGVFGEIPELEELADYLHAFEQICKGGKQGGPIGQLDLADRYRWLTATRSTVIQTSRSQVGFCIDPNETLEKLFIQLVA